MPPAEVYARWDWLRAGIEKAIEKTGAHLKPEDAYVRLRTGTAFAHAIHVEHDIGFVLLSNENDADGFVLFVWVLWAEPWALRGREHQLYAELERIARELKAVRIRMQSPRKGYEREPFFKQVAVVYEREIS